MEERQQQKGEEELEIEEEEEELQLEEEEEEEEEEKWIEVPSLTTGHPPLFPVLYPHSPLVLRRDRAHRHDGCASPGSGPRKCPLGVPRPFLSRTHLSGAALTLRWRLKCEEMWPCLRIDYSGQVRIEKRAAVA
jgi:hypothetical protein